MWDCLQFGGKDFSHEDMAVADLWEKMTEEERKRVKDMSHDKKIFTNLIDSLFPSVYGTNFEFHLEF